MPFPRSPRQDLDWSLRSSDYHVHPHVESRWTEATGAWSEPKLVQDPYLRIHGLAPVLHYGQEAYEGLKACRTRNDEINLIRPEYHARRLQHSCAMVSIPEIPTSHFLQCLQLAVGMNTDVVPPHSQDSIMYMRPVVIGNGTSMRLEASEEYLLCIYISAWSSLHGNEPLDALILEDFDRAAPRGTGSAKVGGNYAPVLKWSKKARSEGYGITLHLDSQTRSEIEEFSTSAFIGVKQEDSGDGVGGVEDTKTVLVVPDTKNVVSSVTSDSVQQLARSLGWDVEKRPIRYEELSEFSEIMAAGTAVSVVSIKSITKKSTGDRFIYHNDSNELGPCVAKLRALLSAICKGDEEDKFGWLVKVEKPAEFYD